MISARELYPESSPMPTIPPLSTVECDYLGAFHVAAICTSRTGKIFVSDNPGKDKATSAFWCLRTDARRVTDLAQRNGDIRGAAERLGIPLTTHERLLERVQPRTREMENILRLALDEGVLKSFNREFRERRLAAKVVRAPFMSYAVAHRKLRRTVLEAVARGGLLEHSLIEAVFDDAGNASLPSPTRTSSPAPTSR
jgi:hypothetical protein